MLNARKLKTLRHANGWTYTQMLSRLAKDCGAYCAPATLANYENGRTKHCRPEMLFALAKLYDVESKDLLIMES